MVTIEFSEEDYRESEASDMEITVARNQEVTLANPVIVRITPLTVEEALDRGIITTFDEVDILSPDRAGKNDCFLVIVNDIVIIDREDFDATIFNVTFGADENAADDISAMIPIIDDDKDEASLQFFIVALEIVDAINMDLINIGRATTMGIIVDNEG